MSERTFLTSDQKEDILYLYTVQCMSILQISKKYNVSPSTIGRLLKRNNIPIRPIGAYRVKKFNQYFFDTIDTEEKAYWLGFIYADGCVSKKQGQKQDVFEVKLSDSDKVHLEALKSSLQSEHSIGIYISNNGFNKGKKYCSFSICNQHLVDSLIDKGVVYNKTHIVDFPCENTVPSNLVRHFIRGYFDGDGSVYSTQNDKSGSVSFTGTKKLLEGILKEIKKEIPTSANVYKYKNKDIYDIKIGGRNNFEKMYNFLYENATIFLGRKKDKFESLINL